MRLIDADAIPYRDYLGDDEPRAYKSQIDVMPTIDPVKHGWWVKRELDDNDFLSEVIYSFECSACNEGLCLTTEECDDKYCLSCGAKMDGDDGVPKTV
ncbi:hypothetical protein KL86CLO1_11649 [uncultured Eubacteriales bacterium]|uniref:Uncharacterized protein n=1 Tax=uncultured Eubacteriales bacterium TaxID=172733 RepID=A0A212JSX0_9FIRM|nr:hypothetical protein KL86CLO1_11649 [uncultured Eubacteriales bacterium]